MSRFKKPSDNEWHHKETLKLVVSRVDVKAQSQPFERRREELGAFSDSIDGWRNEHFEDRSNISFLFVRALRLCLVSFEIFFWQFSFVFK